VSKKNKKFVGDWEKKPVRVAGAFNDLGFYGSWGEEKKKKKLGVNLGFLA
jgi:hypothetical protein